MASVIPVTRSSSEHPVVLRNAIHSSKVIAPSALASQSLRIWSPACASPNAVASSSLVTLPSLSASIQLPTMAAFDESKLKPLFDKIDADSDGSVTREELATAFGDAKADGAITFDEWIAFLKTTGCSDDDLVTGITE